MSEKVERKAYVRTAADSDSLWFMGTLTSVMAGSEDTKNAFTLVEQQMPAGYEQHAHIHHGEDEAFYILEGQLTFYVGGDTLEAGPGSFVMLPEGIDHKFRVEGSQPARVLQLTTPGGYEQFAAEMGEPAPSLTIPPQEPTDMEKYVETAARHRLEVRQQN